MSTDSAGPRATAILIVTLALLCVAFWADCLVGPNAPLAAGFQAQMEPWASEADLPGTERQWSPLLWDGVAQFYPWRLLAARAMRDGELALWNPHQMCGYPFVGNGQSALFYPPNWLLAPVDVKWGFGLLAALHYALAAVLTALLCRALGLGYLPAAFAAIAFTFGGFMVTWTELPTLMNCAAWLPGALLGVVLIFKRSRWGVPVLGVSLAMTLLAGHLQIAAYVWAITAGYALGRVVWAAIKRRPTRIPALAAGVGIGLLLSAAQVLPSLELAANSPRGHGGPSEAGWQFHERVALQPAEWIAFLDPNAFGSPVTGDHQFTRYGITYPEHCGFVGVITLLLALSGLFFARTRHFAFFAVLAALCIHLAMAGPLAKYIYLYVPKIGLAGSFARMLSVFTFAVAMAAAFGLEGISARLRRWYEARSEAGAGTHRVSPATVVCAVALLVLAWELLPWAHGFLPRTRRENVYPVTPAIEALQRAPGRVLAVTPRQGWGMARVPGAVLPPNAASVYGYDSTSGYDSLMLTTYRAYLVRGEGAEVAPLVNGNMMLPERSVGPRQALMGLDTVLAHTRPHGAESPQEVTLASNHGRVGLYEVSPVFPRAFMLGEAEALQTDPDLALDDAVPARWQRLGTGLIRVGLPASSGGKTLCVTETFYPGWNAYVDGRAREVWPALDAFCGVSVRDGDAEVRLVFEPATVRVGCFLTLLGITTLAGIVAGRTVGPRRTLRRG